MEKKSYYTVNPRAKGDIWNRREDGKYECVNKSFLLEQWQIDHDLKQGHIVEINIVPNLKLDESPGPR